MQWRIACRATPRYDPGLSSFNSLTGIRVFITSSTVRPEASSSPGTDFGRHRPGPVWEYLVRLCHRDRKTLAGRLLAPVLRKLMKWRGQQPVDLNAGNFRLRCYLRDNYCDRKFIFTPWRYDLTERRLLTRSLAADSVFLDIGANAGLYTLTACQSIGPQGRVLAFEPNPIMRDRLHFNLNASGCFHAEVLPFGIADSQCELILQLDHSNLGASSVNANNRSRLQGGDKRKDEIVIECKTLLEALTDREITRVSALKIDIEGAEDRAMAPYLKKAPDALLARLIIIENSEHLWNEDIFNLLHQRGYTRILETRLNSVFRR